MRLECMEGWLTFRTFDGHELKAMIFSAEEGARLLASWQAGRCGERYQAAGGHYETCARPPGHEGSCLYRETYADREGSCAR